MNEIIGERKINIWLFKFYICKTMYIVILVLKCFLET